MPLANELRYSLRTLRRAPLFTAGAISVLGLGIGANIAVFSVVDAMLLRPLPLSEPDRLVNVWEDESYLGFPRDTPAPANFAEWKQRNHVFTDMAALKGQIYAITGDGPPEQVEGNPVTANLFPLLGVKPVLGRTILPEEDRAGAAKVALISYRLWRQRYGGDPAAVGRDIRLDGEPHRIIGVMPPGFVFLDRSDIWVPIAFTGAQLAQRESHYLVVLARLKPGLTVESAQRDMSAVAAQLAREYPASNAQVGAVVIGFRDQLVGRTKLAAWVLAGGVGCVLLICCANLAGLMLARAAGRRRELAVRAALGAGRLRLIQQGLAESLLIAAGGGILAILVAWWTLPLMGVLVPRPLLGWAQPRIDLRLLAFACVVSAGSAVLFGILPALRAGRMKPASALQEGGRAAIDGPSGLRRALIAGQVALATLLSVGAGLMVETVWALAHTDLGFRPEGVLTLRTALPASPGSPYRAFSARSAFYTRVLENLRAIPGVISAGYTTFLPLTNRGGTSGFLIEGAPPPPPGHGNDANHRVISPLYLQTLGVRLLAGRFFSDSDGPDSLPVAIVNEAMAKQYWPGLNPLGHRFRFSGERQPWITIVGIVSNVRQMAIDVAGRAEMYFPYTQPVASFGFFTPRDLAIRVKGDPMRYAAAVRQAIWSVDRDQPIADVMPLQKLVDQELAGQETQLWLLSTFAALALLLAALGLYALLAYLVVQRSREIGVRMALGARSSQILAAVLGQGMRLVLLGLSIGVAGALALTRIMQGLLYGVRATDPTAFAAAGLLLLLAGALACAVPALRAARTDPMQALRHQ